MERIIEVGEYTFPAKSTAASLFRYKSNFNRDAIKDLITLAKSMSKIDTSKIDSQKKEKVQDESETVEEEFGWDALEVLGDDFDLDIFFRFLWVFAKTSNKGIPPFIEWLETIEMPPYDFAFEALPQVSDMLMSTVKSSVKSKK